MTDARTSAEPATMTLETRMGRLADRWDARAAEFRRMAEEDEVAAGFLIVQARRLDEAAAEPRADVGIDQ